MERIGFPVVPKSQTPNMTNFVFSFRWRRNSCCEAAIPEFWISGGAGRTCEVEIAEFRRRWTCEAEIRNLPRRREGQAEIGTDWISVLGRNGLDSSMGVELIGHQSSNGLAKAKRPSAAHFF